MTITNAAKPSACVPTEQVESEQVFQYHCSPEWHLARLVRTPLAGPLYSFAGRISKTSGRFHASVVGVAFYFGVSRWKVQRAIQALLESGFFVRVNSGGF